VVDGRMEIFGFEPCAEAGVVDFGLVFPESGIQVALDAEVAQLQLNVFCGFGKITAYVLRADMESGDTVSFGLCLDEHRDTCAFLRLSMKDREGRSGRQVEKLIVPVPCQEWDSPKVSIRDMAFEMAASPGVDRRLDKLEADCRFY
jgi:hypothetical protein